GKRLATGSSDQTVKIWDVAQRRELMSFAVKEGEVRCVAFSPDSKRVAAGLRYGSARVWDVRRAGSVSDRSVPVATLRAHSGETWAIAFTPDGKTLATGGGDWNQPGEVRLWDTATWRERDRLKHTGE